MPNAIFFRESLRVGAVLLLFLAMPARGERFVSLYGGWGTDEGIEDFFLFHAHFISSYFIALTAGRVLADHGKWALEGEVQGVKHFAKQDHFEFNAVLIARWKKLPWDHLIDTSLAIGDGLSYATRIPAIEAERTEKNSRLLNYLMVEAAFAIAPSWEA
ncbi:MAG: hypothetical protein D6819_00310, partial [Gammaproteobacteria bacterium]